MHSYAKASVTSLPNVADLERSRRLTVIVHLTFGEPLWRSTELRCSVKRLIAPPLPCRHGHQLLNPETTAASAAKFYVSLPDDLFHPSGPDVVAPAFDRNAFGKRRTARDLICVRGQCRIGIWHR